MKRRISLLAPAKVNLVLEITNRLPDGFHALDTVFQWLALADTLELESAATTRLDISSALQQGSGLEIDTGEKNLVIRALRLVEKRVGRPLPTQFSLHKVIPAGGGLGGGSADAAAALTGLNRLYELGLSQGELLELASELGADVAFGLVGGTARGRGKGGILESLPTPQLLNEYVLILVIPPFGLSTPSVYRQWDAMDEAERRPARGCAESLAQNLTSDISEAGKAHRQNHLEANFQPETWLEQLRNDLEPAAWALAPELSTVSALLREAGCQATLLCGSGSTVCGLVKGDSDVGEHTAAQWRTLSRAGAGLTHATEYQVSVTSITSERR